MSSMEASVLVVDDDPSLRRLVRRLLVAAGLTVVGEAPTAACARALVARLAPDALLLDVHLPDRDGIDLALELLAASPCPRVLLTSSDPSIARRSAAAGLAFVAKEDLSDAPLRQLLGAEA
jgi:chemotaxis response regulator CheB